MNRRTFVTGGLASLGAPRALSAQPGSVRRIGIIATTPRTPVGDSFWEAFVDGLREAGWVESRNLVIERRYADVRKEAALGAAAELVRAKAEVIVVAGTLTALAAREVTPTVPIVMTVPADPVAVGLVDSLARPGGNVTGLSYVGTEVSGKQVELLKEALPSLTSIAVVENPTNASHPPRTKEIIATAHALRLQVVVVQARVPRDVPDAFREIGKRGAGAAVVLADPTFVRSTDAFVRLAAERRLPVIYGIAEVTRAGGLMSYGPSFTDLFRRAAGYVDKILRGAQARDLPIEQASRFELIINLKTARALNLTMPKSLLLRADQVIE